MVKPFSPTELAARIRAVLRKRAAREQIEPYAHADLTFSYAERSVILADRPVALTAIEYRMLVELSVNAGRVLTSAHLLQRIWDAEANGDVRPMRTVVNHPRGKLGDDAASPTFIFTEPPVATAWRRARDRDKGSGHPEGCTASCPRRGSRRARRRRVAARC